MITVPANLLNKHNLHALSIILDDGMKTGDWGVSEQNALILLDVIKEHGHEDLTSDEATAIWNAKKLVRDWYTQIYYRDTYETTSVPWDKTHRDYGQHTLILLADFLPEIPTSQTTDE